MAAYLEEVRKLEKRFLGMEVKHIVQSENHEADGLARRASWRKPQPPWVFKEQPSAALAAPSATLTGSVQEELPSPPPAGGPNCGLPSGAQLIMVAEPQEDWLASEIQIYLKCNALLEDDTEAERVARRSALYEVREG